MRAWVIILAATLGAAALWLSHFSDRARIARICDKLIDHHAGADDIADLLSAISRVDDADSLQSSVVAVASLGQSAVPYLRAAWKNGNRRQKWWILRVYTTLGGEANGGFADVLQAYHDDALRRNAFECACALSSTSDSARTFLSEVADNPHEEYQIDALAQLWESAPHTTTMSAFIARNLAEAIRHGPHQIQAVYSLRLLLISGFDGLPAKPALLEALDTGEFDLQVETVLTLSQFPTEMADIRSAVNMHGISLLRVATGQDARDLGNMLLKYNSPGGHALVDTAIREAMDSKRLKGKYDGFQISK